MHPPFHLRSTPRRRVAGLGSLVVLVVLGACDPSAELLAPGASSADEPGSVTWSPPAALASAEELAEILHVTLDDEYLAEAVYLGVLKDFGPILPFRNIAKAERQHAKSILALYATRSLVPPGNSWTTDNVPHFGTVKPKFNSCEGWETRKPLWHNDRGVRGAKSVVPLSTFRDGDVSG